MTMHVTEPDDVGGWHLLHALAGGGMPVHRSTSVTGLVGALHAVVPVGADLLLDSRTEGSRTLVARLPRAVLRVASRQEVTEVEVVGDELALVEETLEQVVSAVRAGLARPDGWVRMRMWSWRDSYADMSARQVAAPAWDDVVGNYARSTARELAPLMTAEEKDAPWRLIVAEDFDEYLRADAKQRSGASLGRLLNLCDGILGHGLRVVVLLTTNEDLGSLHPAITRPGRCLSRVQFMPLPVVEARTWLGDDALTPPHPATLAELYALRENRTGGGDLALPELGGYL